MLPGRRGFFEISVSNGLGAARSVNFVKRLRDSRVIRVADKDARVETSTVWTDELTASRARRAAQSVVIKPLLVATSKRLPQRTTESIRPAPGTVSPTDTLWTPSGPCNTTVRPDTCLTVQPSIVFGLVSGVGVSLD